MIYYSHLVVDAEFQKMIRDPARVAEAVAIVTKKIEAIGERK